eukprot:snap_masked-scaffold_50-processed-gene-1.46-mRNA-1 protein AED:1.00 eAED:1.00 QI:0/0/0/0/1/1/2/0/88
MMPIGINCLGKFVYVGTRFRTAKALRYTLPVLELFRLKEYEVGLMRDTVEVFIIASKVLKTAKRVNKFFKGSLACIAEAHFQITVTFY